MAAADGYFRFFRREYLPVNTSTFVPYARPQCRSSKSERRVMRCGQSLDLEDEAGTANAWPGDRGDRRRWPSSTRARDSPSLAAFSQFAAARTTQIDSETPPHRSADRTRDAFMNGCNSMRKLVN